MFRSTVPRKVSTNVINLTYRMKSISGGDKERTLIVSGGLLGRRIVCNMMDQKSGMLFVWSPETERFFVPTRGDIHYCVCRLATPHYYNHVSPGSIVDTITLLMLAGF